MFKGIFKYSSSFTQLYSYNENFDSRLGRLEEKSGLIVLDVNLKPLIWESNFNFSCNIHSTGFQR